MAAERQALEEESPWWGEHVHRYNYSLHHFIKNTDRVLDIACGTGFGTDIIAEHSQNKVIGGDIAQDAIDFCKAHLNRSNLKFQQMDGTQLPFEDDYFDVITSFETIEHTTQFNEMIEEFKRTTKEGGFIIMSTPNFAVNSPSGEVTNPFHTQEWNYDEFVALLNTHFDNYELFGQKYSRYSKKNMAYQLENLLLKRGVRKMPLSMQNKLMKFAGQEGVYPTADDFEMVKNKQDVLKCKTFYVVCRKQN